MQALLTINKLEQVNGAVAMTLDKLPAIRGVLVRTVPGWEMWDFSKLSEAIRLWTRRNPVHTTRSEQEKPAKQNPRPTKMYHARRDDNKQSRCVYCGEKHKAVECNKITNLSDCRQILLNKRLCFNCVSGSHRASHCPSKSTCQRCRKHHHTSICETIDPTNENEQPHGVALTMNQNGEGLFPVLIIEDNSIKCRALMTLVLAVHTSLRN